MIRQSTLARLSGPLFAVLVIAAFGPLAGQAPSVSGHSAAAVAAFYSEHHAREHLAGLVAALAVVPLLLFLANLHGSLRNRQAALVALAGGTIAAAELLAAAAIHIATAEVAQHGTASAAQTLAALDESSFYALAPGFAMLLLAASAIAAAGGRVRWLGRIAIVPGIALLVPPIAYPALLIGLIWIAATSFTLRPREAAPPVAAPEPAAA